ncbi:MAG: HlyD family secretion protein [Alistipes sp.]
MKTNKQQKGILLTAAAMLAVIAVVVIIGLSLPEREEYIQGEVETTDYRVSCKVPSRVLQIRVVEGDRVQQGDTLAVMEAPDMAAKLAQAEAARSAAEAMELKARNGSRQEQIQAAYEVWQQAKAGLQVAEKTFRRIERLHGEGVIATQKFDEAQAKYDASVATERAAKAQYDMAVNGARHEDKLAAEAQVTRAQGAIAEVTSYMNETILRASDDGLVTEIFPEVGELVGTGAPIMNVARMDDVWFTFNIREDLLPGISVGKELTAYLPALDITVPVRITRMKDVGSFAVWKATKALDRFDLKTFEVRARPVSPVEGLHPGMSVVLRKSEIK